MKNIKFNEPNRQNALGIIIMWFRNIWKSVNIFLPLVVILASSAKAKSLLMAIGIAGGIILILILLLVFSYFQYQRFVFYVDGDQFVLEKGVFNRKKLTIPFERIQSVHLSQSLLQRILKITGLEIDTAGSNSKELTIAALDRDYAEGLRNFLLDKREEAQEVNSENTSPEKLEDTVQPEKTEALIQIGIVDLLLIGLSQNHIRTGLAALGIIFAYAQQFREFSEEEIEMYIADSALFIMQSGWTIALTVVFSFLIISLLISMVLTVFRFFNFKAVEEKKGIRITSGLISKKEYQVPEDKIQYLEWRSNPLRKLLGLKTLVVRQASSNQMNQASAVLLPGCRDEHMERFYNRYLPETSNKDLQKVVPAHFYHLRLFLFFWLLPTLALIIASLIAHPIFWTITAIYTILAPIFIHQYFRSIKIEMAVDGLRITKGWVFPHAIDLKLFKIQNMELSQSVFMERRGLFTVKIHTAAGTVSAPFLPEKTAYQLLNYGLYKIENNHQKWM